jgi:hypothetical protein
MVLSKIFGWVLILLGLFFIVALPSIQSGPRGTGGYMPEPFHNSIVFIGVVLVGVGIFLLVKG